MNYSQFKHGGIWISYELAEFLNIDSYPYYIEGYEIVGNLDFNQENKYYANSYVIYIPYEDFEIRETSMVLVYTNTYSTVQEVRQTLEAIFQNSNVECDYINLKSIQESSEATFNFLNCVSMTIYIITLLMVLIIYSRYIVNREYEFCILRAMGLSKKEIHQILMTDVLLQILILNGITNTIAISLIMILEKSNIITKIHLLPVLTNSLSMSCVILILPLLLMLKKMTKFSPAEYLRR